MANVRYLVVFLLSGILQLGTSAFNVRRAVQPPARPLRMGGYDSTIAGLNPRDAPLQIFYGAPSSSTSSYDATYANLSIKMVRNVIEDMQLPYTMNEVRLVEIPEEFRTEEDEKMGDGGVLPDWYLRINPSGTLPYLRVPLFDQYVAIYEEGEGGGTATGGKDAEGWFLELDLVDAESTQYAVDCLMNMNFQ